MKIAENRLFLKLQFSAEQHRTRIIYEGQISAKCSAVHSVFRVSEIIVVPHIDEICAELEF